MVGNYDSIIAAASQKYGVPPEYIRAVMQVESSGNPWARSPKGAAGLMQIMPDTYTDLARRHNLGPDRMAPQNNIMAGTAYLGEMHNQFGNWDEALMAYNMGPGRMTKVRAGNASVPGETRDYLPKVRAALGQGDAGGRTVPEPLPAVDVGRNMYAGPPGAAIGQAELGPRGERGNMAVRSVGGSLLDVDHTNNWLDGLGGLLGEGQSGSQPPGPTISPLQYQLAGAGKAVGELAGITNRRVGIGELLGALGGGLTQGAAAGQQAARQQRADQREETNDRFNNVYRAAMAQKALTPDRLSAGDRFKVAGKQIWDAEKQQWITPPGGPDQGGPLEGTGIDAQMTNVYVTLSQKRASGQPLTAQDEQMLALSERHLMKPRLVTGPDGVVREVAPPPLPGAAAPPGPAAPPPAAAPPAPLPAPDLLDTQKPPATVTPSGSRVTEIVPPRAKEIPATAQTAMLANVSALRKLDDAVDKVGQSSWTTGNIAGVANMLPGDTANMLLPGDEGRAALADIGSMIIHDRSGAAVTLSEYPRLRPFVPTVSDSASTVQMKLGRLRAEIKDMLRDQSATYSADENYKENPVVRDVVKAIGPRAPMSGGEDDPNTARLRSKYGLE